MNESLLPSRYAKALYKFALEKNLQQKLYGAMRNLASVFEGTTAHEFRSAIANPFIKESDKRALIMAAAGFDKTDTPEATALNDFLTLLFTNNRIAELRGIVNAYDTIYRKENSISRVHVTWAAQPEPHAEQKLKDMITTRLKDGSMEYSSGVDSSLIGGFKIAIDNEQLDASVENELRQLRQQILSK